VLWPERIVLACLGGFVVAILVEITASHTIAGLTLSRIVLATSLVCVVAGLVGVFQKPRTTGAGICRLGVLAGLTGLVITSLIEVTVRTMYMPLS
jgi:hypothetical protein